MTTLPPRFADRVRETADNPGSSTFNLAGAVSGAWQGFVAAGLDGLRVPYLAIHQTEAEWESGYGEVTDATPDTLSRDIVLESSNSGSKVTFTSGTVDVFLGPMAATVKPYGVKLTLQSDFAVTNDGQPYNVDWEEGAAEAPKGWDYGGWFDDSTGGNQDRVTVPAAAAGRLLICTFNALWNSNASGWRNMGMRLYDSGDVLKEWAELLNPTVNGAHVGQSITHFFRADEGDYITCHAGTTTSGLSLQADLGSVGRHTSFMLEVK